MEENWDDDSCPMQQPDYQQQNYQQSDYYQPDYQSSNQQGRSQNNYRENSNRRHNENNRQRSRGKKDRDSSRDSKNDEKITFFVETAKLGKLIGRGGSQIRELQDQSGAKITIDKNCVNGDSTLIIVLGSKSAQDKVRGMIDDLLNDLPRGSQQVNNNYQQTYDSNEPHGEQNEQKPQTGEIDWTLAAKEHDEYQKKKWAAYPDIRKNFYTEDPVIANMSKEQVDKIREENNKITVEHTFDVDPSQTNDPEYRIPNPIQTFEQAFQHYPDIMKEIEKQKFVHPSPIQCQAWPILLSGKDMIGIAQTGTGKTLAFLLPALIHIDNQETPRNERSGPTVLIMAPTRELALQIEKEVNKYYYHGIKAVCVYGGGNRKEQINTVSKGVEIVIATPGRLNDLVQTGVLDVKCVSYLVLDEADRMLDMGFEPQIRKTLLDVRPDRQSVMTSATWPPGVRRLAQSYMKNPITVCVGSLDLKAVHSVTQKIYIIDEEEKLDMLTDFFQSMAPDDKAIIFFGKKAKVDDIGSDLALNGVKCQSIHGGRDQCDREQALEDIKAGDVRILLATDVASRGIDIEDITHVFNFDFPRDIEEYVHRVGRTGRAGRTGESISLMSRKDWAQAAELIKILEEAEQEIPDELYNMAERYQSMKQRRAEENEGRRFGGGGGGGGGRHNGGGRDRYGGGGGGGGGRNRW